MTPQTLIVCLLIGTIAGYLAGVFVVGYGFGPVVNVAIGVAGAVLAGTLFPRFDLLAMTDIGSQIISSTIGAVLLLFFVGVLRLSMLGRQGRDSGK